MRTEQLAEIRTRAEHFAGAYLTIPDRFRRCPTCSGAVGDHFALIAEVARLAAAVAAATQACERQQLIGWASASDYDKGGLRLAAEVLAALGQEDSNAHR